MATLKPRLCDMIIQQHVFIIYLESQHFCFIIHSGIRDVLGDELDEFTGSITSSLQKLLDKHPDLDSTIEQINKLVMTK